MKHPQSEQIIKMLRIFRLKNEQLIENNYIEKILEFNFKIKILAICFVFYFVFICFFHNVISLIFFIPISLSIFLFSIHCFKEHTELNKNELKSFLNKVDLDIFKEDHHYNCKNKNNQKLKYILYSLLVYYELIRESDSLNDIQRNLTKYNLKDLKDIESFYLKHKKETEFIRVRLEVRKNERQKPLNGKNFYIIENTELPFYFRC